MAYIINPDGTISVIGVHYDSAGNMKLSGYLSDDSTKAVSNLPEGGRFFQPKIGKRKKKRKAMKTLTPEGQSKKRISVKPYIPTEYKHDEEIPVPKEPEPYFISPLEIEKFILDKKLARKPLKQLEFEDIFGTLKGEMRQYFIDECKEYVLYCERKNIHSEKQSTQIVKKGKKGKKGNSNKQYSPNSIAARAIVQGTGKNTEIRDYIYGRPVNGASRQPKFGYARDYFGRIQERDSYDEERNNEFEQGKRSQRNYDYSCFDKNDDNDGGYEGWD